MRIAWVNLTNGGLSGGSRKYLTRVVPRMLADPRVSRIDMLSPADIRPFPPLEGLSSHWTWGGGDKYLGFPSVKRQLKRLAPDVVYVPTARWVDPSGAGLVVMVRNMEPLLPPNGDNPLFEQLMNRARRRAARRACARADRVIAVSDFVADHLRLALDVPGSKISRIYHGVDNSPATRVTAPPAVTRAGVKNFMFVAGSIRPMRGIEDAVRALALLRDLYPDLTLVIAGAPEGRVGAWLRGLRAMSDSLGVARRLVWAGKLNESEMSWCFRECSAFLMTSRVEACPNTALEAMSHGAPTVSTRNPPMPEFFLSAATYYSADSPTELAVRIKECLNTAPSERTRMRRASVAAASRFSWDYCVNATVSELARARRK